MSSNEVTWKDKLKAYTRTPGSLIVMLLVMLSAIMTFGSTYISDRICAGAWCSVFETIHFLTSLYIGKCLADAGIDQHSDHDSGYHF